MSVVRKSLTALFQLHLQWLCTQSIRLMGIPLRCIQTAWDLPRDQIMTSFLLHCNVFIFQHRVLKLAYLDSLSFSDSKSIYFYLIMAIITQVMGRQMLVTSRVTSKFLRSYLLNCWSDWPYNFRNVFKAQKLLGNRISAKSEMRRVLITGWSEIILLDRASFQEE